MITLNVPGGPNTQFAEAFKRVNQICNPRGIGVKSPVKITASPRDGYICIDVRENQLTEQQLKDLMIFKLSWSGGDA